MQAQLQALIGGVVVEVQGARLPQVFNRMLSRISGFVEKYRYYK